jgi:hypothetical protein
LNVNKTADATEVAAGESVTYSYEVTNTGSFDLDTVAILDDKCAPITGPTGDDGDSVLELSETWMYSCTQTLTETTTNVVTVTAMDQWDNEVQDTDDFTVTVTDLGCTYTQGYWKTHAMSSANPDDTWTQIDGDAEWLSQTAEQWLTILNTAAKGDAWYQLAHQYVSAQLNVENDAYASPAVMTALEDARDLLGTTGPVTVAKSQKSAFITTAGILAQYNEGFAGTPHCAN